MYIGYNIKKINEVMESISSAYAESTKKVKEMYETWFQPSLRQHWVGPDEQNFEKKFVDRLNELLTNSETLATNAIETVYSLGVAWADFQDTNTIGGESTGQGTVLKAQLLKATVTAHDPITFTALEFTGEENLGLTSTGSASALASQLNAFVTNTKSAIKALFDAVDANNAFFGEQTTKVKGFIDKVGDTLGVLATAVKDFDEAMATLTGTSYSSSDSSVSTEFANSDTNLESGLEGLGASRWN
ncbi:MAG: hypothetical protein IKT40_06370 [Bacilli bacterium]|nr:hypothetical protein [Bacilli bacterium]